MDPATLIGTAIALLLIDALFPVNPGPVGTSPFGRHLDDWITADPRPGL